jgi:hypothetical protein
VTSAAGPAAMSNSGLRPAAAVAHSVAEAGCTIGLLAGLLAGLRVDAGDSPQPRRAPLQVRGFRLTSLSPTASTSAASHAICGQRLAFGPAGPRRWIANMAARPLA